MCVRGGSLIEPNAQKLDFISPNSVMSMNVCLCEQIKLGTKKKKTIKIVSFNITKNMVSSSLINIINFNIIKINDENLHLS